MTRYFCQVVMCMYVAETAIDDFLVCELHDHQATRRVLEARRLPGAYWVKSGHPIVMPVSALPPLEDLPPLEAPDSAQRASEDEHLQNLAPGPADCHPAYDLSL